MMPQNKHILLNLTPDERPTPSRLAQALERAEWDNPRPRAWAKRRRYLVLSVALIIGLTMAVMLVSAFL